MLGFKNEYFEVLEQSFSKKYKCRSRFWKCKCFCGNISVVDTNALLHKRIRSCGCNRAGRNKNNKFHFKHGLTTENNNALKHKFVKQYKSTVHPIYSLRSNLITRCYSASSVYFPLYQGRGVKVCNEWLCDPKAFYVWSITNGWKRGLTLGRIDPHGNYEPSNCYFLTIKKNIQRRYRMGCYDSRKVKKGVLESIKKLFFGKEKFIMAKKKTLKSRRQTKVKVVMDEFKEGKLKSGSDKGPKVTNPKQALAIAISVSKKKVKKKNKK